MTRSSLSVSLNSLKQRRLIWQARAQLNDEHECIASGYPEFDQALGGWPSRGLIELQLERYGLGELRLILPALKRLSSTRPFQVWVAPPALLLPHNLDARALSRQIIVRPTDAKQQCWVLEQLVSSACCSAVVCWMEHLSAPQAKRLQVLARENGTPVFIIRNMAASTESLPISLRLSLHAQELGLRVDVRKRQNAWPVAPFKLDLSGADPQLFPRESIKAEGLVPDNILPFVRSAEAPVKRGQ